MIKKLLIKLLGNSIYNLEPIDEQKMQEWLFKSYQNEGFKHYYTMRKKYLVSLLSLGIEGKEMYKVLGRLEELKGISTNITAEFKRRKLETKKA
jgi:hypothetical protein